MRARSLCLTIAAGCLGASSLGAQAQWTLVENLRIGSEDDGPYLFAQIKGVAVGEGGSIFVLDSRQREIRLFDRDGKFVKRVAREGSGPGEIRNANGFLMAPDGRVWVNDPNNARYVIFTGRGDYSTQHLMQPWGYGYTWEGMFDRSGMMHEHLPVSAPTERPTEAISRSAQKIRRVSADGARVDTIWQPACANVGPKEAQAGFVARGRSTVLFSVPFVPNPVMAWDAGGFIWCSSNDKYEMLKIRLVKEDTVLRITASRPPVPVPDEERHASIDRIQAGFARQGVPAPDFSIVPRVRPALHSIDVDDSGRLWVRASTNDSTRTVFDVWDGNSGRQLATVTAPWRTNRALRPVIRGDTVHAVILDTNDVPLVVRAVLKK